MYDPEKRSNFNVMEFIGRNSKDIRYPEIMACAKEIKTQGYSKLGAIGFCYGGWAVFRLAGKGVNLLDCVITAHPSLLTEEEINNVSVPVQLLVPERDMMFDPLKEHTRRVLPTLAIDYDYVDFANLDHGFATRGDKSNQLQRNGLEKAKDDAVRWFKKYLH